MQTERYLKKSLQHSNKIILCSCLRLMMVIQSRICKSVTAIRGTMLSVPLSIRKHIRNTATVMEAIISGNFHISILYNEHPDVEQTNDQATGGWNTSKQIYNIGNKKFKKQKKRRKGVSSNTILFQLEVFQEPYKHCAT